MKELYDIAKRLNNEEAMKVLEVKEEQYEVEPSDKDYMTRKVINTIIEKDDSSMYRDLERIMFMQQITRIA